VRTPGLLQGSSYAVDARTNTARTTPHNNRATTHPFNDEQKSAEIDNSELQRRMRAHAVDTRPPKVRMTSYTHAKMRGGIFAPEHTCYDACTTHDSTQRVVRTPSSNTRAEHHDEQSSRTTRPHKDHDKHAVANSTRTHTDGTVGANTVFGSQETTPIHVTNGMATWACRSMQPDSSC